MSGCRGRWKDRPTWDTLWKCVFISSFQQGFVTKVSKRCAYHILYCGVFCACINIQEEKDISRVM